MLATIVRPSPMHVDQRIGPPATQRAVGQTGNCLACAAARIAVSAARGVPSGSAIAHQYSSRSLLQLGSGSVQTNIVIFTLRDSADAAAFVSGMKQRGVLTSAVGPHSIRFVTHLDVSREDCERAASMAEEVLSSWGGA